MDLMRTVRDWLYRYWISEKIKTFHARDGRVVMVTGSYGKTSVKEMAYDLLRHKFQTVATSGNYNTAVGIAKTLRYEVSSKTELLILEVGAYHLGDISKFCRCLKPDIGVITGIARQHLVRFGSFENIITAKTEIARYMKQVGGVLIANKNDEHVVQAVAEAKWYRGEGREEINLAGAKLIAKELGMTDSEIKIALKNVRSVPNRFEMTTTRYGMRVIDDAYSSNEKGFFDALTYLEKQTKYNRILVTPGLVELGEESENVHIALGRDMIGKVDVLILVGTNERTRSIERGASGKIKVYHIGKTLEFVELVKSLKLKKEPLVLLENDVPENY